jgi:hypothetical protein
MAQDAHSASWSKKLPFEKNHQLNYELESNSEESRYSKSNGNTGHEKLERDEDYVEKSLKIRARKGPETPLDYLPGHPRIKLNDTTKLFKFLVREFCSDDVDLVADKLWWMSKQDKRSISPLHRQKVKGRKIILSEDSKLHLVWIDDRIYIKPLPKFLLSYTFWKSYLDDSIKDVAKDQIRVRKAALGYLRTWLYLIKYESDFRIALDYDLIPKDTRWDEFCDFTSEFEDIQQSDVHPRYAYGEIRLTRLNLYAPIAIRKQYFQRVTYQYGAYFAQFYGPILFFFGILSVVLSGMQVAVAVEQASPAGNSRLLIRSSLWFGVVTIICSAALVFCLAFLWVYKVANEWKFALRDHYRVPKHRETGPSKA